MNPVPRKPNPMFSSRNRLKLGVFGLNIEGGCTLTSAPERLAADDWSANLAIAKRPTRPAWNCYCPWAVGGAGVAPATPWASPTRPTLGPPAWPR